MLNLKTPSSTYNKQREQETISVSDNVFNEKWISVLTSQQKKTAQAR